MACGVDNRPYPSIYPARGRGPPASSFTAGLHRFAIGDYLYCTTECMGHDHLHGPQFCAIDSINALWWATTRSRQYLAMWSKDYKRPAKSSTTTFES
eukprot:6181618-Karenia_brevis.AAC.1